MFSRRGPPRPLTPLAIAAVVLVGLSIGDARAQARRPEAVDACISASETAQLERAAGRLESARIELSRCLASDCPALIRRDCEAYLADVEKATPTVVFRVRDERGDVEGAEIRVDGAAKAVSVDGRARAFDPGPHDVEVVLANRPPVRTRFVAEETVKGRIVEIQLPVEARPSPSATIAVPRGRPTEGLTTGALLATIGLAGLSVVGLGTFTIVGLGADADYRELRDTCGSRCEPGRADDLKTRFLVADVALGVSVVALAASALVYVLGPRDVTLGTQSRRR